MFDWKESYSVNIKEIDDQHKELFKIGNKLSSYIKGYDSLEDHYDEIKEVFKELKYYTIYHFRYEEELMRANGYEDIGAHKAQHDAFIDKLVQLESGGDIYINQKNAMINTLSFLLDWISNHILKTDMRYKPILNEKGIY
ncbi:bacteriohemerythrin [Clostridium sp. MSJ-4]|uniref:Bacteriohemerythrin n=1 Tax=Clostridium simiarum TaxID=2841506 RepID=A0ABS6F314_9CLOT|nr:MULTISPECIES: bacteriohemerythrin [Clostridium]MBU5592864.1 bacteriohemerythrin [Clostridium simiarum]